jgi:hypothetical protein
MSNTVLTSLTLLNLTSFLHQSSNYRDFRLNHYPKILYGVLSHLQQLLTFARVALVAVMDIGARLDGLRNELETKTKRMGNIQSSVDKHE